MSDESNLPKEDALEKLAQKEVLNTQLKNLAGVFIGLSLIIIAHAVSTTYNMLTDNSVPVVVCPRTFELDAPVIMNTIDAAGIKSQDRWIRGFVRRFITKQFPRTKQDAKPFFEYIIAHSKGEIKYKYQNLMQDVEGISDFIDLGFFYRFYPKSEQELRIRPVQDRTDQWVIELDGFLIKRMGDVQERYNPTLRYTVEAGTPTLENPEGLYVVAGDIEQITDYVSGRKESL